MATKLIIISISFLAVIQVRSQFFDIFQDIRPFTYQTLRPLNPYGEITTKRPKTTTNQRNKQINTQDKRPSTRVTSEERDRQTARDKPKWKTTVAPNRNTKPRNKEPSHKNDHTTSASKIRPAISNERNFEYNQPWQDVNNVQDYTVKPIYNTRNQYTTYNPLYNRPGVKPAVLNTNRPPITNRPATQNPFSVFPRPTDGSVIRYPTDSDDSPQVLTGPDEDSMTEVEKRRYAEVAERMCDRYKALSVQQVEAIPLLPSPELVKFNITDCEPVSVPLVVGGKVVSIREFPHMALLGWNKLEGGGYSWKCGGSLVSDKYVLTAAHCAYQDRDNSVVTGAPRVVQLGSSYLDDPGSLVVKVTSVYRHPKYTQSRSYYDVALLKLAKPVSFSAVVKPACLGVPPPVGDKVIATGWGRTEFGADQSLELRSVSISIWDMQDCKRILSTTRKLPNGPSSDSQVCAGERGGNRDTCQGDSGGPAQVSEGCIWRVVAVTSVGRSCGAPNTPALYATVHKPFIAAQIFADQIKNEKPQNNFNTNDNRRGHNSRNNNRDTNNQGNRQSFDADNYRPNNNWNDRQSYRQNNNDDSRQRYSSDSYRQNNNNGNRESFNTDSYGQNNNDDSRQRYNTDSYRQNNNNGNRDSFNTDSYGGDRQSFHTDDYQLNNNRRSNNHNQDNYYNRQNVGSNYDNSRNVNYGGEDRQSNYYSGNSGTTDFVNNNSKNSNNYYSTAHNNRQRDNYRTSDIIYYPES